MTALMTMPVCANGHNYSSLEIYSSAYLHPVCHVEGYCVRLPWKNYLQVAKFLANSDWQFIGNDIKNSQIQILEEQLALLVSETNSGLTTRRTNGVVLTSDIKSLIVIYRIMNIE